MTIAEDVCRAVDLLQEVVARVGATDSWDRCYCQCCRRWSNKRSRSNRHYSPCAIEDAEKFLDGAAVASEENYARAVEMLYSVMRSLEPRICGCCLKIVPQEESPHDPDCLVERMRKFFMEVVES